MRGQDRLDFKTLGVMENQGGGYLNVVTTRLEFTVHPVVGEKTENAGCVVFPW